MSWLRRAASRLGEWLRAPGKLGVALALLVIAGLALRFGLVAEWRPAFVNYSDSGIYFQGAGTTIWADPIRTVGYSLFLKLMNGLVPGLLAAIVLQHLLGVASALLLFVTLRIGGAPGWVALGAAAVLLVGGFQIMIEHAALSEGIYLPLLMLSLFGCVKAWENGSLLWAVVVGLSAGLGIAVKGAATAMVPIFAACLLMPGGRPILRRLATAAVVAVAALTVVGVYIGERKHSTGQGGLVSNGAWNLYGRVAPWADCDKFTVPEGADALCQQVAVSDRAAIGFRTSESYIFSPDSPARKITGAPPYLLSPDPKAMGTLQEFSRAAILGQPFTYLDAVVHDFARVIDPAVISYGQLSPDEFRGFLIYGPGSSVKGDGSPTGNSFVAYWQNRLYPTEATSHSNISFFVWWDRVTTPVGPVMALALLLALFAPLLVPSATRFAATLMAVVAYALILFPIATKAYDFRFVIPSIGPLTGAALLGVWGAYLRMKALRWTGGRRLES